MENPLIQDAREYLEAARVLQKECHVSPVPLADIIQLAILVALGDIASRINSAA